MEKTKRNANLDILRVVCMMMVITLHYFGRGAEVRSAANITRFNYLFASTVGVLAKPAVNCFYLISGYFMTGSSEIKLGRSIQKVKSLWIRTFLCSVLVTVALMLTGIAPFRFSDFIRSFFPIMTREYWFITVFLLITLVRPYLGRLLDSLSIRELAALLGILFVFDSLQTTFGVNGFDEIGFGFLHAVMMLTLGYGASRLSMLQLKRKTAMLLYLGASFAACVLRLVEKRLLPDQEEAKILLYNSPLIILSAFGLFAFFLTLDVKSEIFSKLAPHYLTIYLVNSHPLVAGYFWQKVLHTDEIPASSAMIPHYILCVLGFTAAGILLDLIGVAIVNRIIRDRKAKQLT